MPTQDGILELGYYCIIETEDSLEKSRFVTKRRHEVIAQFVLYAFDPVS